MQGIANRAGKSGGKERGSMNAKHAFNDHDSLDSTVICRLVGRLVGCCSHGKVGRPGSILHSAWVHSLRWDIDVFAEVTASPDRLVAIYPSKFQIIMQSLVP